MGNISPSMCEISVVHEGQFGNQKKDEEENICEDQNTSLACSSCSGVFKSQKAEKVSLTYTSCSHYEARPKDGGIPSEINFAPSWDLLCSAQSMTDDVEELTAEASISSFDSNKLDEWNFRAEQMKHKFKGWKDRADRLQNIEKLLKDAAVSKRRLSDKEYEQLYSELKHNSETNHDDEIKAGLPHAFCLILDKLLKSFVSEKPQESVCIEMENICVVLNLIYSCSDKCRQESIDEIGNFLIPLLINVLNLSQHKLFAHDPSLIIEKVVLLLCLFVQVPSGRDVMSVNPHILTALAQVLNASLELVPSVGHVKKYGIDVIWMISKLAFNRNYSEKVVSSTEITTALITSCKQKQMVPESAAAILNLTAAVSTHEKLVGHAGFLEAIQSLMSDREEMSVSAQRRATASLGNLASTEPLKTQLINFNGGSIIDALLTVTTNDGDPKTCQHAVRALKKLTGRGRAEELASHNGFIRSLLKIASANTDKLTRKLASEILAELITEINHPSPSHNLILWCLVEACNIINEDASYLELLSQGFLSQANEIENQKPMVQYEGLLEAIASLGTSENPATRNNIVASLQKLAKNKDNRKIIACNRDILNMAASVLVDKRFSSIQHDIYNIISLLVEIESNRLFLANHSGLLEALICYSLYTKKYHNQFRTGLNAVMLLSLAFEEEGMKA